MQQIKKKCPNIFTYLIALIITLLYLIFIKLLLLDREPLTTFSIIIFMIFYHVFLILLIWSILQSIWRDPGLVPKQWVWNLGFQQENRPKKYCLICHVFKPQRTHHCSTCNRCVLNMDHHWYYFKIIITISILQSMDQCIKPFILMLIYTVLITFMDMLLVLCSLVKIVGLFKAIPSVLEGGKLVIIVLAFVFNCVILVTITLFLKFHIQLILGNMTTLQTLELKRQGKDPNNQESQYNIGKYYNWIQVFGSNWLVWWIPMFIGNSGPTGDGVLWPKRKSGGQQEEELEV